MHKNTNRGFTPFCHAEFISASRRSVNGFTLIELLVVVLIIGILAAVAVPQYQKAVLKSRYSAMMPFAKAIAEANEAFYLEHGNYADNPQELTVQGQENYPDGTSVLMYSNEADLSFVRTANASIPNARYVVYQKHSANFPDTTQCEAADERAHELCQALGGQIIEGGNSSGEAEWTAYLLSGRYGSGDTFTEAGSGDNNGGNSNPQTPTCSGEQPANIKASQSGATGTATCVNGQWVYEWTGGTTYAYSQECTGDSAYACAGAAFIAFQSRCTANTANACSGSTFTGDYSSCYSSVANGCSGTVLSGLTSYCDAAGANACAGAEIQAGAQCSPYYADSCNGALYGAHPDKDPSLIGSCNDYRGYCPTGVPVSGPWNSTTHSYDISGWKGNCCNPKYMVSGTCPSDIPVCS